VGLHRAADLQRAQAAQARFVPLGDRVPLGQQVAVDPHEARQPIMDKKDMLHMRNLQYAPRFGFLPS
jgi:hypothetical protein